MIVFCWYHDRSMKGGGTCPFFAGVAPTSKVLSVSADESRWKNQASETKKKLINFERFLFLFLIGYSWMSVSKMWFFFWMNAKRSTTESSENFFNKKSETLITMAKADAANYFGSKRWSTNILFLPRKEVLLDERGVLVACNS
jgi:hypothetical protein